MACNNLSEDQIKATTSRKLLRSMVSCLEYQNENLKQFIP